MRAAFGARPPTARSRLPYGRAIQGFADEQGCEIDEVRREKVERGAAHQPIAKTDPLDGARIQLEVPTRQSPLHSDESKACILPERNEPLRFAVFSVSTGAGKVSDHTRCGRAPDSGGRSAPEA